MIDISQNTYLISLVLAKYIQRGQWVNKFWYFHSVQLFIAIKIYE